MPGVLAAHSPAAPRGSGSAGVPSWTRRSDPPHHQPPAASGYVALCKGSWEASEAVLPPLCASPRRGFFPGLSRPSAERQVCRVASAWAVRQGSTDESGLRSLQPGF